MNPVRLLAETLAEPARASRYDAGTWNAVLRAARKEWLTGALAARLTGIDVPETVAVLFMEAERAAADGHRRAGWETEKMYEAVRGLSAQPILLKGSAYLAADLPPLPGRNIGDLDILVPRAALEETEAALKAAGWRSAKPRGSYDDRYYREWMHELPPLEHRERGGIIDLHHTILPRTSRLTPQAGRMIERAVTLPGGERMLSPPDMVLHAAAHLAYDGDFTIGLRNLWDVDRLVRGFATAPDFFAELGKEAARHQLSAPLARTLRLADAFFETPSPAFLNGRADLVDRLALHKLQARNELGHPTKPFARLLLYLRGHWLRMPPFMLARHLIRKALAPRTEVPE